MEDSFGHAHTHNDAFLQTDTCKFHTMEGDFEHAHVHTHPHTHIYAQTGTGKSHTMEGNFEVPELKGIIPSSFDYIFSRIAQQSEIGVACVQGRGVGMRVEHSAGCAIPNFLDYNLLARAAERVRERREGASDICRGA